MQHIFKETSRSGEIDNLNFDQIQYFAYQGIREVKKHSVMAKVRHKLLEKFMTAWWYEAFHNPDVEKLEPIKQKEKLSRRLDITKNLTRIADLYRYYKPASNFGTWISI